MLDGRSVSRALFVFAADASVTAWRRGDWHNALTVGGVIVLLFNTLVSTGQSLAAFWGIAKVRIVASISFMGLVAAMEHQLSLGAVRVFQLDHKLQLSEAGLHEIEERMRLAVERRILGFGLEISRETKSGQQTNGGRRSAFQRGSDRKSTIFATTSSGDLMFLLDHPDGDSGRRHL